MASTGYARAGGGETLVLLATLLWAVEVVLAKRLLASLPPLTVGLTRTGSRAAAGRLGRR